MKDNQDASSRMDFAGVIAPVTPETFFAEYFERKHLVVRRDDPAYYGKLLSVSDIDRVLTEQMLRSEELQLVKAGKGISGDEYVTPSGLIDPVRVARFFDEGATIVLPGLQKRLTALAACSLPGFLYHWYRPDGRLSPAEVVRELSQLSWRVLGLRSKRRPGASHPPSTPETSSP